MADIRRKILRCASEMNLRPEDNDLYFIHEMNSRPSSPVMIKINATRSEVIACIIKCINWMHLISFQIRRWIFQGKNVKRFGGWSKNDESSSKITVTKLFCRMCTYKVQLNPCVWGSYNNIECTSFRVYKNAHLSEIPIFF